MGLIDGSLVSCGFSNIKSVGFGPLSLNSRLQILKFILKDMFHGLLSRLLYGLIERVSDGQVDL